MLPMWEVICTDESRLRSSRFQSAFTVTVNATPSEDGLTRTMPKQYAAYMIQIAYRERGYMGARVQVRDDGATKVFEVKPGRIYHVKAMKILGRNDLPAEAMSTASTVGDVYSAARINEWIATVQS